MSRSAPFNPTLLNPKGSVRTQKTELLSEIIFDIREFRDKFFPPAYLSQIRDLPIYHGNADTVKAYHDEWRGLIERAQHFYPTAGKPPDFLPLPANLDIPQFIYRCDRVHLTKTKAKESLSFRSIATLIEKCGEFSQSNMEALEHCVNELEGADFKFVAHREFIDLRAYVFGRDAQGVELEPQRIRFYRTGLILAVSDDFKIVDSRQFVRKKRSDAYSNPVADNGIWRVFLKRAPVALLSD